MPTSQHAFHNDDDDGSDCVHEDSEPLWPFVIATGAALFLGYFLGRIAYRRDLQDAIDRAEQSPGPIAVSIRTL